MLPMIWCKRRSNLALPAVNLGIVNRDLKLSIQGRGSAVSLQLIAVGTRQCRVLYVVSKSASGIDVIPFL